MTRIMAVSLMDDPDAVEWLQRPQLCDTCRGEGSVFIAMHDAAEGEEVVVALQTCHGCFGCGFTLWVSWN